MAVVITKEIKKKRTLLAVFAGLVLVSLVILYYGFLKKDSPSSDLSSGTSYKSSQPVSDLNVKILEDQRFKNLQTPPGVPLNTNTTGKSNPFSD